MKKLKQLGALVLALMLAVALCCPAVAAGETTYTITINNAEPGHTYEAYQIFAGDLKVTDGKKILSNITWGNGITDEGKTSLGDAVAKANTLTTAHNAATFAEEVARYLTTTPTAKSGNFNDTEKTYTIDRLNAGYYLVKDEGNRLNTEDDFRTAYIMQVVGNVEVSPKSDKPSVEKKVKDTNDTTGETSGWQDSADYDIGDSIPFQLTGTVASNYDAYETYKFIFHDQESAGLTFDEDSVEVYVDGNKINKDTYQVVMNPTDTNSDSRCTFHIVFDNLKKISAVHANSKIVVEYEATLNTNAVIGSEGNPNEVFLEYSNNPNNSQGGENDNTGKTPKDKVIVFTYKAVINKVNENSQPLTGAEFTLKKIIKGTDGKTTEKVITAVKNTNGTTFTFEGLDDGQYILEETVTPEGYNSIKPITFEIKATHDTTSVDPKLTDLNGNKVSGEITFTRDLEKGSLTSTIVNQSGSTLPTTGGMGTTVLYVVGGALVVCAGVALVAKKRMQ